MCRRQPGIGERIPPHSHKNNQLTEATFPASAAIGRLCEKCDGKWCVGRFSYAVLLSAKLTILQLQLSPVCDSYVRPETLVRICDECNFGTYGGRCIICGSPGISDAYYCAECTRLEKDRDGCPKIVNLGASRTDLFYERRRLGESSRCVALRRVASCVR
jgi:hypothetical protein